MRVSGVGDFTVVLCMVAITANYIEQVLSALENELVDEKSWGPETSRIG